jgi:hypothetical protein
LIGAAVVADEADEEDRGAPQRPGHPPNGGLVNISHGHVSKFNKRIKPHRRNAAALDCTFTG